LKIFNFFLYVLISAALSGCTTIYNSATQRKESYLIGTQQEVSMGSDMDKQIQGKLKMLDNPLMQARLNRIGERLSAASDRQDVTYHFKIVEDKDLNAFAIPGGYVYVNSGLMNISNDSELAGVLAHEIGHVAARHSIKKLQAVLGYQIIMGLALGISGKDSMGQALDVVFNLSTLGYGRKDESLADKLAVKYTRIAGFDPHGLITFFEKLKKEAKEKGNARIPVFLSSHPQLDERIRLIKNEIEANQ